MMDHFGINVATWTPPHGSTTRCSGRLAARQMDFGTAIGYGVDGKPTFWIPGGGGGVQS